MATPIEEDFEVSNLDIFEQLSNTLCVIESVEKKVDLLTCFLKDHLKVSGTQQDTSGHNRHSKGIVEVSNKKLFEEITDARNDIDKLETKIDALDGFLKAHFRNSVSMHTNGRNLNDSEISSQQLSTQLSAMSTKEFWLRTIEYDDVVKACTVDGVPFKEELGKGGFGAVYKGTLNCQEVAVKKLKEGGIFL